MGDGDGGDAVERAGLVLVEELVEAAVGGAAGAVRVAGAHRSGLTTFLHAAATQAAERIDVQVVSSDELVGPYATALHLLGLPELTLASGVGRPRSFFEAGVPGAADAVALETLLRAAEARVGTRPQLWVIDDIHLAGPGVRAWLSDLMQTASLPVAVLYGTHDPAFDPLVDEPSIDLPARRFPVTPVAPVPGDRLVLTAAAVAGQRVDVSDVAAVLVEPFRECVAELADLERTGLMEADGSAYRFVRGSDRRAVIDAAPLPVRASLHAEFAKLLMARDDDPVRVATHLAAAGTRVAGDVDWLTAAAEHVVRFDAHAAVDLLDRAVALTAEPPRRLSMARVRALSTVGRTAEAEALARLLLVQARGDEAAVLHRDLGLSYFHQGRAADTVAALDAAAETATDPALRARFTAELGRAGVLAARCRRRSGRHPAPARRSSPSRRQPRPVP